MRIKCEHLLRNPVNRNRPLSSDKIESHLSKKKGISYLNYGKGNNVKTEQDFPSPPSTPKYQRSSNTFSTISNFPQLRIQPKLITVYSQTDCYHFSLLKSLEKRTKGQTYLC